MNNAFFGKTCEDVRKYKDIKIARDGKKAQKLVSRPQYNQHTVYDENLVAIQLKRTSVEMNKPRCIGQAILEISKLVMYDFHYNSIMRK